MNQKAWIGLYSPSQKAFHIETLEETINIGINTILTGGTADYIVCTAPADDRAEVEKMIKYLQEYRDKHL